MPVITTAVIIATVMVTIAVPMATLAGRSITIRATAIALLHMAAIGLGLRWRTHDHGARQGNAQAACDGGDRAAQFFHDLFPFEKRGGAGLTH